MHDAHCHLDLFPDPVATAVAAERMAIITVAVTNLPSAFFEALPHISAFRYIKPAVGMHPLLAAEHTPVQKRKFGQALMRTGYVGEIGLDFSQQGIPTREQQLASFRFVLSHLQGLRKVITVHSRRAESALLDLLTEFGIGPVIFHWYSGPRNALDRGIGQGHYFSINPSMVQSANGRQIIDRIPRERILTETDGPFVKVNRSAADPKDVQLVVHHLATHWGEPPDSAQGVVDSNFRALHAMMGVPLPPSP